MKSVLTRNRGSIFVLLTAGLLLTACNTPPAVFPTKLIIPPATNTLAPVYTQTQRFTATPIPSPTFIPSPTVETETPTPEPPQIDPPTPTATPTQLIKAVIKLDANLVSLRAGPGTGYRTTGSLKAGSPISIVSNSADGKWSLVRLDDGTEGWISFSLITLSNPSATVPVLTTPELTERAQLVTAIVQTQTALAPTAEGGVTIDKAAPTHIPRIDSRTDVLAYCDQRGDSAKNRKFTPGSKIVIFWSWIAKTPEQMKDHLNNVVYTVKVNGQILGDWAQYASKVIQQGDGSYITYWFVPIGTPASGNYKVEYNVTWKAAVNDGTDNYGPGTDKASETGTCSFTINAK